MTHEDILRQLTDAVRDRTVGFAASLSFAQLDEKSKPTLRRQTVANMIVLPDNYLAFRLVHHCKALDEPAPEKINTYDWQVGTVEKAASHTLATFDPSNHTFD